MQIVLYLHARTAPCCLLVAPCKPPMLPLHDTMVVHQTHFVSRVVLQRFALAQRQVHAAGGEYFVSFLISDEPLKNSCDTGDRRLADLHSVVGKRAVWCIDPGTFSVQWPTFFERTRTMWSARKAHPPVQHRYQKSNSLGFNWAWANCDLLGIVGLLQHARQLTERVRWLWTLDWDIGWLGDISALFSAFSVGDSARLDYLVGSEPTRVNHWFDHFSLRNHLSDGQVWAAMVTPQRFSMRMLRAVNKSVTAGNHSFCEMRSTSLCPQLSWCRQGGMTAHQELFGNLSGKCAFYRPKQPYRPLCAHFFTYENFPVGQQEWENYLVDWNATNPGRRPPVLVLHPMPP